MGYILYVLGSRGCKSQNSYNLAYVLLLFVAKSSGCALKMLTIDMSKPIHPYSLWVTFLGIGLPFFPLYYILKLRNTKSSFQLQKSNEMIRRSFPASVLQMGAQYVY